ncbi:MAG: YybH family protein [Thermoanaerobaculia bacterium]
MKRFLRIVPAFSVFVALVSGCRGAERAPEPQKKVRAEVPDPARTAAVEAALQRYGVLVSKMDDEGISEMFTTDGEMGSADSNPLRGRAAILRRLGGLHDYRVQSEVVTSESVTFDGNDALQKGTYHQVVLTPSKNTIDARGRLEALWTLEADGVWRLKRMTAFPDAPGKTGTPKG